MDNEKENLKNKSNESILIINYAMDSNDPIFSHQFEAVEEISKYFRNVFVITGKLQSRSTNENITIYSTNWKENSNRKNIKNFLKIYFKIMNDNNPTNVFSHMTAVQSGLICLHTWLKRKKHYLWYAHASNNIFLILNYLFLDGFVTSTKGSFPFRTKKLRIIGQAINSDVFSKTKEINYDLKNRKSLKLVHIGRFDKSKNIDLIISSALKSQTKNKKFEFTQIGEPSNFDNINYYKAISNKYKKEIKDNVIKINANINRKQVPFILSNYDIFIHAFEGSLDKSVVEATLLEMPVVTINKEYINEFGGWNKNINNIAGIKLDEELNFLLSLDEESIRKEIQKRKKIAIERHSLDKWASKISNLYQTNFS
jgi:glycosyltransferase involved in cell wall biosynthesis